MSFIDRIGRFSVNYTYNVSIIIVNYNGKRYIDNLFDSLDKLVHDDFSFQVVFVDNNSSDDSIEYLENKAKNLSIDVKIVKSDINRGFAGGNNYGVANCDGDYIVFLNNDTAVDTMWLSNLYHYMIENDYGMVNSKLLFYYDFVKLTFTTHDKIIFPRVIKINGKDYTVDNKFCKNLLCEPNRVVCFGHSEISLPLLDGVTEYTIELDCTTWNVETDKAFCLNREFPVNADGKIIIELNSEGVSEGKYALVQNAGSGIDNLHNGYDIGFCELDDEKYAQPYEINNGCGAAIILKKEDFIKAGLFDERFFMYYEDTDLSYRIKKLGKKIMFYPDALVRHIHTGSSTEWSDFFLYHVYRNKLLFVWKNDKKSIYFKYFIRQYLDGIKNKSKARKRGTWDSLRVILGKKNVHF